MDDRELAPKREVDARVHRQLFLDDESIAWRVGLPRKMHRPARQGPVLEPDSEAGEVALQSRSVPQWNSEKGYWEWWYWGGWSCEPYGQWATTTKQLCQLAISTDGLDWEKPDVGRHEWKGSKHNNILVDPEHGSRAFYHVVRDERDPDPAKRYKGLLNSDGRKPAFSADGVDWELVEDSDIVSSDESHFFYDDLQNQFVALVKRGTGWGRSVFLATTEDFIAWQEHGIVLHADQEDWDNRWPRVKQVIDDPSYLSPPLVDNGNYMAETYQMAAMTYEGFYVGFPGLFNPAGAIPPPHMNHTGINQAELAMSRDLKRWRRLCNREVFIGVQPWDGVSYDTAQTLLCGSPQLHGDEIRIYYNACRFRGHKELHDEKYHPYFKATSALSLATLRRDGFVSLHAEASGELLTQPLRFQGADLYLNADAAGGDIQVEVLNADTLEPIGALTRANSESIKSDDLAHQVSWFGVDHPGSVIAESGLVRLRFHVKTAELYAFWMA